MINREIRNFNLAIARGAHAVTKLAFGNNRRTSITLALTVFVCVLLIFSALESPYADPHQFDNQCMTGFGLAHNVGWNIADAQPSDVTAYGGIVLDLKRPSSLPKGWEAIYRDSRIDANVHIHATDAKRDLPKGLSSIYPPPTPDCRTSIGASY